MTDDQKKSIEEIVGHLGAALSQMASTDDAIIIGHIQAAHAEAAKLMSGGKSANTVHPIFQPILDAIAPECPRSLSKRHEYETRRDWMGDPSIPNGTTSWEIRRCRWCAHELTQCDCGTWFDPVGDDGEDLEYCPSCRENEAEAAYERSQEEPCFRGGEWAAAQREEALRIKRELK